MEGKSALVKSEIIIRNLELNDVLTIAEIEKKCGLSRWGEKAYRDELNKSESLIYVAEHQNQIVGFVFVRLIMTECELLNIGVLPEFQNLGSGQLLLNQMIVELKRREISEIFLEVRQKNQTARNFYEKNKFKVIGKRKHFYTQPSDDAVLYKLEIEDSPASES